MPLTIIVGGQFGGEGKGSVTAYLAMEDNAEILIKTGGPNSAHTYGKDGIPIRVRMLPSGANLGPRAVCYPAGCLIHLPTLFNEVRAIGFKGVLLIDPNAGIVEETHIVEEKSETLYTQTGSTRTGTGAAVASRAKRQLRLAKDIPEIRSLLVNVSALLAKEHAAGTIMIAEGAQAFGLSNYHGDYPYATSRDCTVSAMLSQIGLGYKYLDKSVLVLKCFPTRNKIGNGALRNELSIESEGLLFRYLTEFGGGTYSEGDLRRRVGLFDFDIVERAVRANSPDFIALTGLDRLEKLASHPVIAIHYGSTLEFIERIEKITGVPVALQGWGPYVENIVDLRCV